MNWNAITDAIDTAHWSWVQVTGWAILALIAGIVLFYVASYVRLSWYVYKLNRMQRKAAEALAKRGGRTWPL